MVTMIVIWVIGSFISAAIHADEGLIWLGPFWPLEVTIGACQIAWELGREWCPKRRHGE